MNYTDGVSDKVNLKPTPLYLSRSEDHGKTWTTELAKVDGNDEFIVGSPFGKMLTLSDGRIMMHYYLHGVTAFITSDDDGHTWSKPTVISDGGYNETGLCDLGDGILMAVFREDDNESLWQSRSEDDSKTWSEPIRITDATEHPGDVIKLDDGRVLLTYGRRSTPFSILGLVSHDNGKTWDTNNRLLLVADAGNDQGYPSNIQRDDGAIVTVYYSDQLIVRRRPRPDIIGIHGASVIYSPKDLP